jgi:hypothetical protein
MTRDIGNTKLAEQVTDMIADQTRCNRSKVRPQADLFLDLGVDGDDAEDLLRRFREEFGVNLEALQFGRHFGPEGFNPLVFLLPSWWRWKRERIPVTVADLVEAARTQTWPIRYGEGPSA